MTIPILPVSVVIPCYRSTVTIDRAFNSVLQQTAKPAEVILIDDASGDGTLERLRTLQSAHGADWVKIISRPSNGGPSSARNSGWEAATQPHIAFLDADDAWHPRKLEIQHAWMSEHVEAAITSHAWLQAAPGTEFATLPDAWSVDRVGPTLNLLSNRFPTLSVMVRRDLPLRFEPRKRLSEDYLLWCRILLTGRSGYRIELPLAHRYKKHHGGHGRFSDLWAMEKAEQDTYSRLYGEGLISAGMRVFLLPYSFAKHLKRLVV